MSKLTKKDVIIKATKHGWSLEEKKHKYLLIDQTAGFSTHEIFRTEIFVADSLKEVYAFLLGFEQAL